MGPKDKKELMEENPYMDPMEAELLDDDRYIDLMVNAFEEAAEDLSDMDEEFALRQVYEDSILAEFGYIDQGEEDEQ